MALYMDQFMSVQMSAPHQFSLRLASSEIRSSETLLSWPTFLLRMVVKMPFRCCSSGNGMNIFRSNLPARRIAWSTRSILLVAPTIITLSLGQNPSIQLRNWLIVVVVSWESLRWLSLLPRASISSTKIMQPFLQFLALANNSLILFGPIPTNTSWNSEATTLMKLQPASLASARASKVLPVPGGPQNIMPLLILAPIFSYLSELFKKSITSLNFSLISSPPQQSSKLAPPPQMFDLYST